MRQFTSTDSATLEKTATSSPRPRAVLPDPVGAGSGQKSIRRLSLRIVLSSAFGAVAHDLHARPSKINAEIPSFSYGLNRRLTEVSMSKYCVNAVADITT